jgi:predicted enzyme related to lactoylglutathione lyase
LKAQRELLSLAEKGVSFTGPVLSGLNDIEKGYDFVKACSGKLDMPGFMDILTLCDQPTIDRIITEEAYKKAFLESKEIDGYYIRNNSAIYYTLDMEATLEWFNKVLGWPGIIEAKDEAGNGVYGLILPHDKSTIPGNGGPYMEMMRGEPVKPLAAMIQVWGVDSLRQRALDSGWTQVTPVNKTPWGARLFDMTTCDGSLLQFYEPGSISV